MQDYFVQDANGYDGMIVNAPGPVDAAQRYIDIQRRVNNHEVDPYGLSIYPITRKDTIIHPIGRDQL